VPHVVAVMTGQPVRFEDADQTLHNIHPMPKQQPRVEPVADAQFATAGQTFSTPS